MVVVNMRMPLCERCGELWLPQKGESRDHPEMAKRCGKCKSPNWNKSGLEVDNVPDFIPPASSKLDPNKKGFIDAVEDAARVIEATRIKPLAKGKKCQHGLVRCPACHGEKK